MQDFAFFEQFRRYLGPINRFHSQKKCYFYTGNCWWNEVFLVLVQTE